MEVEHTRVSTYAALFALPFTECDSRRTRTLSNGIPIICPLSKTEEETFPPLSRILFSKYILVYT